MAADADLLRQEVTEFCNAVGLQPTAVPDDHVREMYGAPAVGRLRQSASLNQNTYDSEARVTAFAGVAMEVPSCTTSPRCWAA